MTAFSESGSTTEKAKQGKAVPGARGPVASYPSNVTTALSNGLRMNHGRCAHRGGVCHAMGKLGSKRNPKGTVSRAGYAAYIQSDAWRAQRLRYWQSKLPKQCFACGLPWTRFVQGMHMHHRAYWNLGNERLIDIIPLCQPCHAETHKLCTSGKALGKGGLYSAARRLKRLLAKRGEA